MGIRYRSVLPSIFTLGILLCGFLAVANIMEGDPHP